MTERRSLSGTHDSGALRGHCAPLHEWRVSSARLGQPIRGNLRSVVWMARATGIFLQPFRMHARGSGCGQADRQDHRENSRHGGLCRALNRRGRPCKRNTDTTKDERKQMNKKTNPARGRALPALSMSLLLASMAMTACSTVPPQQRQEDIRACARLGLPAGSKENINCMILQQHNRERNVYR